MMAGASIRLISKFYYNRDIHDDMPFISAALIIEAHGC